MRSVSRESLLRSLDDLCIVQQEHNVRIGIENMGSWECLHFRQPDLVPELASRDLGFMLDVGHARLNNVLEKFAETGAPCHIHFHDNTGSNDDHAACGAGTIDFARILPHLPDNASRVIEVSDIAAYEQSVAYLEKVEQRKEIPHEDNR